MFRDPSIGNQVKVETVKLIALRGRSFSKTRHRAGEVSAAEILRSFCSWQRRIIQKPHLYDLALLVTRERICQFGGVGAGCEALGLAELGTICSSHSCALVQDIGLTSATTIAHELGHV